MEREQAPRPTCPQLSLPAGAIVVIFKSSCVVKAVVWLTSVSARGAFPLSSDVCRSSAGVRVLQQFVPPSEIASSKTASLVSLVSGVRMWIYAELLMG